MIALPLLLSTHNRGKIREKYNISGSVLGDGLAVWCCLCCAVAQQSRELKDKGLSCLKVCAYYPPQF
jgi:Cys-rich protein (TIGR01571 family)